MKQKVISFLVAIFAFTVLLLPQSSYAAEAEGIPDAHYPGTQVVITPGDVIYSNKSLFGAQPFVGHVAVVGNDGYLYHAHPEGPTKDTLSEYMSRRHKPNETITVYRASYGASAAASWAAQNIYKMKRYWITNDHSTLDDNYCSKFVWQAFYYGGGTDLTASTGSVPDIITPSKLISSGRLVQKASFDSRATD
ncbi:hypothetical protein ACFVVQ_10135 [Paenibacillus chitinolyticus]|uniref:hypothetical protein n=1 Tax=Paenibacillus chitinolyticus TaxID=79263 RepID=UPI0036DE1147